MRNITNKLVTLALAFVGVLSLSAQSFTSGSLVVSRVGDGTTTLANTAGPMSLLEFSTTGTLLTTTVISSSATSGLQTSGTATSEGMLSLSADRSILTLAGYNAPFTGSGSLSGRTDAQANRAVVTIDSSRTVSSPNLVAAFSGNNIRSAVANGNDLYLAGGITGTVFRTGTTNTTLQSTNTNTRVVNIFNNNLYYSTGSATQGIYAFSGLPTAASTPSAFITGVFGQGTSPYDFAISPDSLTAYVADSTLGVQKFTRANTASAWSMSYNITTALPGLTGLAVDFSTPSPTLFAVNPTNLYFGTDNTNATFVMASIATAGNSTYAFRGLEFAPTSAIPEPSSYAAIFGVLALAGAALRRRSRK